MRQRRWWLGLLFLSAACTSAETQSAAPSSTAPVPTAPVETTERETVFVSNIDADPVALEVDLSYEYSYSADIAVTHAEVDHLVGSWALDAIELRPGFVLLTFVLIESSTPACALGAFLGLEYDDRISTIYPVLGPSPWEAAELDPNEVVACNSDANPSGYAVLVAESDLPNGDFRLDVRPSFRPSDAATAVDSGRRSPQRLSDTRILRPMGGLDVGATGVALRTSTQCGVSPLPFDVDGLFWVSDGGPEWDTPRDRQGRPDSWVPSSRGDGRLDLVLTRTSETTLIAVPLEGGEPLTYVRVDDQLFEPCP